MIDRLLDKLENGKATERVEAFEELKEFLKDSGNLLAAGEHYEVLDPVDIEDRDLRKYNFFGFVGNTFRALSNAEVRKMR